MKQKFGLLIFSIFCGLAAMFLMQYYISSREKALNARYQMVEVVVAAQDIPQGTQLTDQNKGEYLAVRGELKRNLTSDSLQRNQIDIVVGQKFQRTVIKNTPLKWSDFEEERSKGSGLAGMVPENERAVSIPVDLTSSVTGLVEPNDHVDILGTFTFPSMKGDPQLDTVTLTILQNVTVLATGKNTARTMNAAYRAGAATSGSYSTVTLLVSPKEAEMLVFALQKGRLTLTLRNPADVSSAKDLSNINFSYLEKKIGEFNDARQDKLRRGLTTP
jgi:pilus assembly protein CpaB